MAELHASSEFHPPPFLFASNTDAIALLAGVVAEQEPEELPDALKLLLPPVLAAVLQEEDELYGLGLILHILDAWHRRQFLVQFLNPHGADILFLAQFLLTVDQHGGVSTFLNGMYQIRNRAVHLGLPLPLSSQFRSKSISLLASGHGLAHGFLKCWLVSVETVEVAQCLFFK